MDYRPAEFIRFIGPSEPFTEVLNEGRAETWRRAREHAALLLQDERIAMVRGGFNGIMLEKRPDGIFIPTPHGDMRVIRLAWHVHPMATGPSDHDRAVLADLNQDVSVVYEINGERDGTWFTPEKGRRP